MTDKEKMQLVCLLRKYQSDLLEDNERNIQTEKKYASYTQDFYDNYKNGVKAQYNHARIIADKLDIEINRKIKSI